MPDNTQIPGSDEVYASNEIDGAHYQRVKLIHGEPDTNNGDVSRQNALPVIIQDSRTAFGELAVAENTPQVQAKFPYNLNTDIVQKLTNGSGSSVTVGGGLCTVTCEAAANKFSQIRTLDVLRYGPGQGANFKGTCAFTTGEALSSQVFGPGDDDEGFFFGYDGTSFGVLHRSFGELEIRTLTITSGADAGGGDFVITMDGTAVTITVGVNDTISEVAAAIVAAAGNFGNAGRGWEVRTDDNITIEFISFVAENAAGTFSFSDTDSGVTAGAFTQATTLIEGVAPTETWVAQSAWNRDKFDGTGPSGVTLSPTNLTVYNVQYQFLGAGTVVYCIENPVTGILTPVHVIERSGAATTPVLRNPTLHLNMVAKTETGYSGSALVMTTGSMAGFIEGQESVLGVRHGASNAKDTTGTTPVNVLLLNNEIDFQGTRNKVVVYPDHITIASEAVKTVTFKLIVNPTQVDGTVALADIDAVTSVMQADAAGTTVVGGNELMEFTLSGAGSKEIDIKPLNLSMRPGDRWAFTAELSSGANEPVTVGVTWLERV